MVFALRADLNNQISIIMKAVSKVSTGKQALLVLVGLCVMYFIGHYLVNIWEFIVIGLIGKMDVTGFAMFASVLPAIPALKGKAKAFPITLIDHVTKSGRNRKAMVVGTEDGRLDKAYWYACIHPNYRAKSIFDSQGYSTELKKPVYLLKNEYANQDGAFVQKFLAEVLTPSMKEEIETMAATKESEKQATKDAKKATKGTAKGSNVSAVNAKIQALKDLHKEGLLTIEQLSEQITKC